MSTPISVGLSASTSTSQNPDQGLQGGTYINFGSGLIESPGNISPETTANPVATAEATGQGTAAATVASGTSALSPQTSNILLYASIGIGVLALLASLFVILEHKKL
jgi:hypothetical protein